MRKPVTFELGENSAAIVFEADSHVLLIPHAIVDSHISPEHITLCIALAHRIQDDDAFCEAMIQWAKDNYGISDLKIRAH